MSWYVLVLKFDGPPSLAAMDAEGFQPPALGTAEEVRERISAAFSATDWADPTWGDLDENGYSIEFPVKPGDVDSLTLIVRGGGNPVDAIANFCQANGWVAYDVSSGQFLEAVNPDDGGWRRWQAYRDQVIGIGPEAHSERIP